jgi:hypothetical protein
MVVEPETPVVRLENFDLRLQALAASRDVSNAEAAPLNHDHQTERDRPELEAELVSSHRGVEEARRHNEASAEVQGSIVPRLTAEDSARRIVELVERGECSHPRSEPRHGFHPLAPEMVTTTRRRVTFVTRQSEARFVAVKR